MESTERKTMTNPERIYKVLAEYPRGIFADTLALLAEVSAKNISSLVGRAQRFCPHGRRIEGETTCQGGFWKTKYRLVKNYNVGDAQVEIKEAQ